MLRQNLMTRRACQRGVMRNHFLARDLAMARAAVFRRVRQHRVMGLVALRAEFSRVVLAGDNLRKPGGPCRVVIVADGALTSFMRDFRRRFTRILGMRCGRPVADFAGEVLMI